MASVRRPRRALASASPAATVVLPTPPLPTTNCSRRSRSDATVSAEAAEAERHVGPAEAEGVGERRLDLHVTGAVLDVVEVALRIRLLEVDGGRQDAARER